MLLSPLPQSKLALGTAQFGYSYGIANVTGQVALSEVASILQLGQLSGVDTLDTAVAYGESEERLGSLGVSEWRVISKLPPVPDGCTAVADWVHQTIQASLRRLRLTRVTGFLLHRPLQLLGPNGPELYRALLSVKSEGLIGSIGCSITGPEDLAALSPKFQFDLVQAPFNILDRRLVSSGWLTRLSDAGIEIHVRSVFLQGLLLMEEETRPPAFRRWQLIWDQWARWLGANGITPLEACLGFVTSHPEIDRVIVGVDSVAHFRAVLSATRPLSVPPPHSLSSDDPLLINPSCW